MIGGMDSPTDLQSAAFYWHWQWIYRIAIFGIVTWAVIDREAIDPKIPLAIMALILFLDFVLRLVRWTNRRKARRPPDAP